MVRDIEKHSHFADKALSQLKHNSWSAMNSYTHGGMLQVGRRINGNIIEPKYDDDEIIEVLRSAGTFGLLALLQMARLANKEALAQEINRRIVE
jgi:predicted glycosyl hydrolase (DUF1957 family)